MAVDGVQEVLQNIYLLRADYDGRYVNFFLIKGKSAVLIDTGVSTGYKVLTDACGKLRVPKSRIRFIINTHSHWDHIGLNSILREEHKSMVLCHQEDVAFAENHMMQWEKMYNGYPELFAPSKEQKERVFLYAGKESKVDLQFHNDLKLRLGDAIFEIVPTPGHTEGSICIYESTNKLLFSGDSILGEGFFGAVPMYCNVSAYIKSLNEIKSREISVLLPGHSPPIRGSKRVTEFLEKSEETVRTITEIIIKGLKEKNRDTAEISRLVCMEMKKEFTLHCVHTTIAHLDELSHRGLIKKTNNKAWSL